MNFLAKLKILAPAILAVVPGAQPFVPLIVAGMTLAEESQQPGAEKKKLAIEATKLAARTANTIAKRPVLDEEEAGVVATDSIDAIVGVVNIIDKLTPEAAPVAPVQ